MHMHPNFFILGAAKSGTTSLHYYLSQHPDIYISNPKEPPFFQSEYEKGLDYYWRTYFSGWNGEPIIGEAAPRNLYLPYVAQRIRDSFPGARLIVILRNPVTRIYSAWWMNVSLGLESLTFEQAVRESYRRIIENYPDQVDYRNNESRVRYRWYLDMGHYAEQLQRYYKLFPKSQIRVYLFDELISNPSSLLCDIFDFLGAQSITTTIDLTPRNTSVSKTMVPFFVAGRRFRLDTILPPRIRILLRNHLLRFGRAPIMSDDIRMWLQNYYNPHNQRLAQLLGRDLSGWN